MQHKSSTTHTYELTADEVTEAIIDYVMAKQKAANKAAPTPDAVMLNARPNREVTIVRDEGPDRSIVGAIVKFAP